MNKTIAFCPLCNEDVSAELIGFEDHLTFRGKEVNYMAVAYNCPKHPDKPFLASGLINENLKRARSAFREQEGLLQPEQIISFRKQHQLSKADLARLVGLDEETISRYETKAVQSKAHDDLLRLFLTHSKKTVTED